MPVIPRLNSIQGSHRSCERCKLDPFQGLGELLSQGCESLETPVARSAKQAWANYKRLKDSWFFTGKCGLHCSINVAPALVQSIPWCIAWAFKMDGGEQGCSSLHNSWYSPSLMCGLTTSMQYVNVLATCKSASVASPSEETLKVPGTALLTQSLHKECRFQDSFTENHCLTVFLTFQASFRWEHA